MTIIIWVLFLSSMFALAGSIWFYLAGKKAYEQDEAVASAATTLLKEAKLYNDEATQSLIDATKLLDQAKQHLEKGKQLVAERNFENVKIVNSDPRVESGEISDSNAGFDSSP